MKKLLGQIKASKTTLYFHSASLGILFLSFSFIISNLRSGTFNLYVASDSMEFLHLTYITIVAIFAQFIALILFAVFAHKVEKSEEKSIYIESFINSLTITNICLSALLILRAKYIFQPNTVILTTILLLCFFITFFSSTAILEESIENDRESIIKKLLKRMAVYLWDFTFPYYKLIGASCFVVGLIFYWIERIFKKDLEFVYLGSTIIAIGAVYFFLGGNSDFKKKDELQRRIILEQSYFKFRFMLAIIFTAYLLSITFRFTIDYLSIVVILLPVMLISTAFIKDKYE